MTKEEITCKIAEAERALTRRYADRSDSQRLLIGFQDEVNKYQSWVDRATADIEVLTNQLEILNLAHESAK